MSPRGRRPARAPRERRELDVKAANDAGYVKMPNVKDLTPEQRKELMKQLQQLSTP